jgi:hypothetical protein
MGTFVGTFVTGISLVALIRLLPTAKSKIRVDCNVECDRRLHILLALHLPHPSINRLRRAYAVLSLAM